MTDRMPRISVVTPSYNQGRYLEQTLRSVLDQDYAELEYIVVDGGSTDASAEIISRYADRLAFWSSEPDGGQTDALIKGFAIATGDIMCWLNADDLFEPWTLADVGAYFASRPEARAVYGDGTLIDAAGRPTGRKREPGFNRFIWLHDHNFIPQPSAFWRRDLYDQVGGLNPALEMSMDADLWIRFADVTRVQHVRRDWSRIRRHREQKSRLRRADTAREDRAIRRNYVRSASPARRGATKVLAKAMRVGWKLAKGCYW